MDTKLLLSEMKITDLSGDDIIQIVDDDKKITKYITLKTLVEYLKLETKDE